MNAATRRPGWRLGAALLLLGAATVAGHWLWRSVGSVAAPAAAAPQARPAAQALAAADRAAVPPAAVAPVGARRALPWTPLGDLLARPPSTSVRWSRFEPNPAVIVIEYPNLREQGLAMNRLAAMFEKRGAERNRVPTEAELAALMRRSGDTVSSFYQGHDYPADKVARFFSQVEMQRLPLNPQETRLRDGLVEAGLIKRAPSGAFQAMGEQAVVSFTGVQPDDRTTVPDETIDSLRREAVLRHELSHGEFFTNAAYRAHSLKFWRTGLTESERRMFRDYLQGLDYDPADEELMANETQALLMHTPDARAFSAATLGTSEAALADLRRRFRQGEPAHGLRRG